MNILSSILDKSKEFNEIISSLSSKSPINVNGAIDSQKAHLISTICTKLNKKAFVVTHSEISAKKLCSDLSCFLDEGCVNIPPNEVVVYKIDASDHEMENDRAAALNRLSEGMSAVVSIESLLHFVVDKNSYNNLKIKFEDGKTTDSEKLADSLISMGYSRVDTVYLRGQFAIRGGIVDIFSPDGDMPVRMELFGDDIDSMRSFDPDSQLSTKKISEATIIPVRDVQAKSSMLTYLDDSYMIFLDEPSRVSEAAKAIEWEMSENIKTHLENEKDVCEYINDYSLIIKSLTKKRCIGLNSINTQSPDYKPKRELSITAKGINSYSGNIEFLINDVKRWIDENFRIIVLAKDKKRCEKLKLMFSEHDIKSISLEKGNILEKCVNILEGRIAKGFEYPTEGIVVISDKEIFSDEKKKRTSKKDKNTTKIKSLNQLEVGDFVVHRIHGIGKYLGIVRMKVNNISKDYIKLKYRGEDNLYLPVNQLDAVSKYTGADEKNVKLNRLGSPEWANAKRKVRQSVEEMARKLVLLYAEREKSEGIEFSKDTPWQQKFEDLFPYEETKDQLQSTLEMKRDMESKKPMDRLLCGDVGYGKTEVAMRGAFKAVMDGYQVAYLVPTTILASQHYQNFLERMKEFPITVRMLSRFSTPSQTKKTLKMLQSGECDIVIGTHKLLSKNVIFKKLGFLIVDEEQRFGVSHKEKIKEIKKNVDVLTLSATPIPRTLHMAMIGIRDMSVLTEPPSDRYPVQTYVLEYNESVIKNAIEREIARGGQIYYLHNRVESIYKVAQRISALVPDARVLVAHGRMNETELDEVMLKVQNGEADVLVCTTIIETGLDIANVNTIIIENADTLGLSQLYQLRGRVGRSSTLAYAYLTYKKNKMLDEVAEKRLRAIKEFTEFGSGFKIAMRDLEIRGAGNVLGPEQHGFMLSVGYEMYCEILNDAIGDVLGVPKEKEKTETLIDLNVSAFIPESFIPSSSLRVEAYKQIAQINDESDRITLEEELIDRYGEIPKETYTLLDIQMIRLLAQIVGIKEISHTENGIIFKIDVLTKELTENISNLAAKNKGKILFGAGENAYILLREKNLSKKELLESVNKILKGLQNKG